MLASLPAVPDLPALEREVLARWQRTGVFLRSLQATAGGPLWTVYEGPPTANGMPGVHHVEARVFKDAFPRYRTMRGWHVPRRAGWDCHGLPVEVAVEKALGLAGKPDIEAYGIAEFNQRCRESVLRHVDAFAAMTARMGYWTDLDGAYRTMDASYIESVWWSLKIIFGRGLLVRDFRISPYCPRCGTPLSDHELGQPEVYQEITDPAVTVRFPLLAPLPPGAPPLLAGADLLVWTTTPWTLVANTAVAVHPAERYVLARKSGDGARVVVAAARLSQVLGEGWHVLAEFDGASLAGAAYEPPFSLVDVPGGHRVVTAGFVTAGEGTGLVHLAPAFGADDLDAGRQHGLPVVNPVRPDGRFAGDLPLVGGLPVRDASELLIASLADRGRLFRSEPYRHSYPHCWRCGTPLLYYALPAWYIRTTAIKDQLLAENSRTRWHPPTIRDGRYGEWLRNNVDWALSRSRYWATPLPLWECGEGHLTCVGSLAELSGLAGRDLSGLDPHRPYVDDITLACPSCGGEARRVPEVIDAWYDSGAMPFAQFGTVLRDEAEFRSAYPAQFICEAIDQTRGWFYALMAVGTLITGRSAYEEVLCLGLITDASGRKMSTRLGNVIEPMGLMDRWGADALRWFFLVSGSPWVARKISEPVLAEIARKVLLTFWSTAAFLVLYARAAAAGPGAAWHPGRVAEAPPAADRPLLDRWALAGLHTLIGEVTAAMEAFDAAAAGRRIAAFIDDLSNWYVRRSRRRFWAGPGSADGLAAFATLYECVHALLLLMAPLTPFLADYLWDVLRPPGAPDSVHLAAWPQADPGLLDPALTGQMALARRLTELGRSARASAGIRTRQPLGRALTGAASFAALPAALAAEVAAELNVRELGSLDSVPGGLVQTVVRPNFRALGRRFGPRTQAVARAVAGAEPVALAARLAAEGSVTLLAEGSPAQVGPEDVIITQQPREGWAVASEGGETVALDTAISPALRREGLAREVVRLVQEARKQDGFQLTDRIRLLWRADGEELAGALAEHAAFIGAEVLATGFGPQPDGAHDQPDGPDDQPDGADGQPDGPDDQPGMFRHHDDGLGLTVWLRKA
jgi:isoleucyl-tRNA synthetase